MTKRLFLVGAVISLMVLTCRASQAKGRVERDGPANAASQQIQQEARRILTSIQSTLYQHKTEIDEQTGSYHCDCSGFAGYLLSRTVAKDDPKGPLGDGKKRPQAKDFEIVFEAAPAEAGDGQRWQHIVRVVDARPGDIIAWRHETIKRGQTTGHVVIVDETPVVEDDGLVRVVMIDSTTQPQVDDTRAPGTSGIGRGSMWFTVDEAGRPIGHVRGSRGAKAQVEPISIGRALPVSQQSTSKQRPRDVESR